MDLCSSLSAPESASRLCASCGVLAAPALVRSGAAGAPWCTSSTASGRDTEIFSGNRAAASFCLFVSERDLCREGSQWLCVCVLCGILPVSVERSVLELTTCVSVWGWCELGLQKAFSPLSVKRETLGTPFSWRCIHFGKAHFPLGCYSQRQRWERMLQQDRPVRAAGPGYAQCFTAPLQSGSPWVGLFCQRVGYNLRRFRGQTGFDAYRQYSKVL